MITFVFGKHNGIRLKSKFLLNILCSDRLLFICAAQSMLSMSCACGISLSHSWMVNAAPVVLNATIKLSLIVWMVHSDTFAWCWQGGTNCKFTYLFWMNFPIACDAAFSMMFHFGCKFFFLKFSVNIIVYWLNWNGIHIIPVHDKKVSHAVEGWNSESSHKVIVNVPCCFLARAAKQKMSL